MATKRTLRSAVSAYYAAAKKEHESLIQAGRASVRKNAATSAKGRAAQELADHVRSLGRSTTYIPVGDNGLLIVSPDCTVREDRLTKV